MVGKGSVNKPLTRVAELPVPQEDQRTVQVGEGVPLSNWGCGIRGSVPRLGSTRRRAPSQQSGWDLS